MLGSGVIQAKLRIGKPNDKYEQEADSVADRVMSMPELANGGRRMANSGGKFVQRQGEDEELQEESEEKDEIQAKPISAQITPLVQRQEDNEVQGKQLSVISYQLSVGGNERGVQKQEDEGEEEVQVKPVIRREVEEDNEPVQAKLIQLMCSECEEEAAQTKQEATVIQRQDEDDEVQEKSIIEREIEEEEPVQANAIQRQEEEPDIMSKSDTAPKTTPFNIQSQLNASKGSGSSLPKDTRNSMESSFGADFSGVRVHTDSNAAQMSKELSAQAFTHGSDIYFNQGKYNPDTNSGKRLLGHELTHTVQQGGSSLVSKKQTEETEDDYLKSDAPNVQAAWYNVSIPFTDYEFDPSLEGLKNAANIAKDAASDAFMWIYHKIEGLVTKGINWINNKWNALKSFASKGLDDAKNLFNNIVKFVQSPLGFLSDAIMNMDVESIKQSWGSFTQLVLSVWDRFHKMGMGLLNRIESLWNTIKDFADNRFKEIDLLTNHWAFRKLPSRIRNIVYGLVRKIRALWNKVKSDWKSVFNKVKTFVNKAFKAVEGFVENVLSFAIDKIITGILQFGKLLLFIKDFLSSPKKYLEPLSQKIAGHLDGVEGGFEAQVAKYFGSGDKSSAASLENETGPVAGAIQRREDQSAARDSSTWSEIGEGVWDIMKKKWDEVKKNPLSIVLNLLMDMVLPVIGNVKDIIKLFNDIKTIVIKPFRAATLKGLWTTILHLLDIPILIYNAFWSIVGRSLMLPLVIASFVPHPVVKGIAIAAGYALLGALISGELANIGQKLLLLKTGNTNESEKKDAYNRLSDSLIAFAMEASMAIIMVVVAAVANVIKGVFSFVRGKVFKPKTHSTKSTGGGVNSRKSKDIPEPGKKKILSDKSKPSLETTKHREGKLEPEEIKVEFEAFKDGKWKKSNDPEYEWEIELPNGHTWKRKKNGKWCRFTSKHCFDDELPLKSDREFYEYLKKEGVVTESFEDFMKTKPNQRAEGTDISNEIISGQRTKPKTRAWDKAPNWRKWVDEKGGMIFKHSDDSFTYVTKDGTWVRYNKDGYPDFSNHLTHPEVKSVDLLEGFNQKRTLDYEKANKLVGKAEDWGVEAPEGYRWHHHEKGRTLQLVPRAIHELFDHLGGIAKL